MSLRYWNLKSPLYPFHAQEDCNGNRVPFSGSKTPKEMEAKYGEFLRCPVPEIGVVLWGFTSEATLQRFLSDFDLPDERGKGGPQ